MEPKIGVSTTTNSETSDTNSCNSKGKGKPSSKFKGVVPQANGNWGAQIYANHHRIWLGTFKTEDMAGMAYDSAATKLRHGNSSDPHRNFPLNDSTVHEPAFQVQFTTEQVLNLIKDGSYQTKFQEFLSTIRVDGSTSDPSNSTGNNKEGYVCKELFRKSLTPSDVGKLNRLVIPKRYAVKYFNPHVLADKGLQSRNENYDDFDFELTFYDMSMKSWKFRYCYWKSSSSFVFTRGWNNFVRAKGLKHGDTVAFFVCEVREKDSGNDVVKQLYMIDYAGLNASEVNEEMPLTKRRLEEVANDELQAKKARIDEEANEANEVKSFRLFGVEVFPENCVDES